MNKDVLYYESRQRTMGDGSAGVAELADARDLKSRDTRVSYRFDPGYRHQDPAHLRGIFVL